MNILQTMESVVLGSLVGSYNLLASKLLPILLPLIFILVFLGIGLWMAESLSDALAKLIKDLKIGKVLDTFLEPVLKITKTKINPTNVLIGTVKWVLISFVLIAALDIADLDIVTNFAIGIVGFIPNVLAAALILVVGAMLADLAGTVAGFVSNGGFPSAAKVAVNTLAILAAFTQLVTPLVHSLSGFVDGLHLSTLRADVLFIGIIVIALLASRDSVTKIVEGLHKS